MIPGVALGAVESGIRSFITHLSDFLVAMKRAVIPKKHFKLLYFLEPAAARVQTATRNPVVYTPNDLSCLI